LILKNLKILAEFGLCFPEINDCIEQIFSVINEIWIPEKNIIFSKNNESHNKCKIKFSTNV